jgi:uncharacterized protein (DUF488 family)
VFADTPNPQGTTPATQLLTIGYGNDRAAEEFIALLRRYNIEYLVDVRSKPYSKYRPEFSKDALAAILTRAGFKYVFMGDSLGGLPSDPTCFVDGKVSYAACREKEWFRAGLARLAKGVQDGRRIAIMCAELEPERCHRSKLVGEALRDLGVPIAHIDDDGELVPQERVMARLDGGQAQLFGSDLTSRKKYQPSPPEGDG